jgi:hypothetical protein
MKPMTKQIIHNLIIVAVFITGILIYSWLANRRTPAATNADLPKDLNKWYQIYNSEFFNDKLPKNTVIDWSEYDDSRMASTSVLPDGRFHISLNEKYCLANRVARIVLKHEACHVATFSEITLDPKSNHGPRWRTCMLNLYQQGAFKGDLIDGVE